MFQGFTDETFEFFMALSFNNNREFFHENHEWYMRAVRRPALELAAALGESVRALSPELETRPERVVSRINRDLRFTNDKTPYRDYIWLAFRRPREDRKTTLGAFFDLSCSGASFGMGFYQENRPLMNGLRRRLTLDPQGFCEVLSSAPGFTAHVDHFKRKAAPAELPEPLRPWYLARSFYFDRDIKDFTLIKSPALAQEIVRGYTELAPLFAYFDSIAPEEDPAGF
ncbi:MAG: DUF2461 domain-containing protein [Eubacteriales bacterium]|nr:DUF2461 domain-containing protein [Eubacteriales bacterium]